MIAKPKAYDEININEEFEKKQEHKSFLNLLENKGIKIYKATNKIFFPAFIFLKA